MKCSEQWKIILKKEMMSDPLKVLAVLLPLILITIALLNYFEGKETRKNIEKIANKLSTDDSGTQGSS